MSAFSSSQTSRPFVRRRTETGARSILENVSTKNRPEGEIFATSSAPPAASS